MKLKTNNLSLKILLYYTNYKQGDILQTFDILKIY